VIEVETTFVKKAVEKDELVEQLNYLTPTPTAHRA
jgi:hypothetical protein